jgi:hypothetical protein
MNKNLINEFVNPGNEYRGAPFWAWNGKLDPEELRRQIRTMHEMGLGGFFMHSRVGLATAYLSDEWFECVRACIDEAEKLDMQAWLYDEDRWPSGAAGGLVTANHEYRMKSLVIKEINELSQVDNTASTIAWFTAKIDGSRASNIRQLDAPPAQLPANTTLLHVYTKIEGDSSWYNGQAYLDTINRDAVNEFIRVTHEKYKTEIGDQFGGRVPGIFTDEPNYGHINDRNADGTISTPWTQTLFETFTQRYGYDLIPLLPELFYDVEGVELSKARLNYIDCITFMFVDAFARQTGEWCEANNMQFTGHCLEEPTLATQANAVGAAMRFYEYMQAPGIDILTEYWREYATAKQVSSAARQFNRKWRLSETNGCTGWDFPFAGHKAISDWQAALGINLRCQHLAWYTMEGEAKRDYPASIFYQSPWYKEYKKVEDYFSRINLAMTQGAEVRDVLVVHPIESMWTMIKKDWKQDEQVKTFDLRFSDFRDALLNANIDFDFGDEEIMSRHASCVKNPNGATFKIAHAEYKVIVIPEMITMRASTIKLLEEFKAAGGKVILAASPAAYVDGVKSDRMTKLAESLEHTATTEQLIEVLGTCGRRLSITDENGMEIFNTLYQLREDADSAYVFICNTSYQEEQHGRFVDTRSVERTREYPEVNIALSSAKNGKMFELDLETGEMLLVEAERHDDEWKFTTSLPALGSRMFIISPTIQANKLRKAGKLTQISATQPETSEFKLILSEANILPLDRASLLIDGKENHEENYILELDGKVRDYLNVPRRGGQMVQPWLRDKLKAEKSVNIQLDYEFFCDELPSGDLALALEQPLTFVIELNGIPVSSDDCGWWCDRSLRKLRLESAMLRHGRNQLKLKCDYAASHPGLESIFLLGNFGVNQQELKLTLTSMPDSLPVGDWCNHGLPFYSGAASYGFTMEIPQTNADERIFIHLPEYHGSCAKVIVNGQTAGVAAWAPNEVEVSGLVNAGLNEFMVEIFSSRRNSHGPLYGREKWPTWTGPGQLLEYTGKYNLVPCGLMQKPVLKIKK